MDVSIFDFMAFLTAVAAIVALIWLPLGWRRKVCVVRRVNVNASAQMVWRLVSMQPGPVEWHPHLKRNEVIPDLPAGVRQSYEMKAPDGTVTPWQIDLDVARDDAARTLTAERIGLEKFDSLNDRLLGVSISVEERANGCRLTWREEYGPRSLAGRFMVYSDIDGALSQLRSYCETGQVCMRSARSASWTLSLLSAFATVCAFAALLGWQMALLLAVVLSVHELGHLVSFRLIGQPWGRIMFVPFIGGVAVSRVPHKRLADDVFCALMGAGLSLVLLIPAAVAVLTGAYAVNPDGVLVNGAIVCAALAGAINLLNLLPVFPLDGGRIVRAIVQSIAPDRVRHAMFGLAGLIAGASIMLQNPILTAVAAIAFFQGKRLGPPKRTVEPMDRGALISLGLVYAAVASAHAAAFVSFSGTIFG